MENQRLFLIIALVFVLFLIWQQWLAFQAEKYPPPVATAPTTTAQPGAPTERLDLPGVTAPVETATPSTTPGVPRVRVVTDVFEAEIDPSQGDLRYVGLRTYPESLQKPDKPYALLQDTGAEVFIAQSGLLAPQSPIAIPNHYLDNAARFVAAQTEYRLEDGVDTLEVPLTWTDPSGLKIVKTYTFRRGDFTVDVTHRVENGTGQEWVGRYYRQFQRTPPAQQSSFFGVYTYTGGVISTPEQRYTKISFDDMAKKNLDQQVSGGWVAMIQHYFVGAWVPDVGETNGFFTRKAATSNRYVLGMVGQDRAVPAGASAEFRSRLFVGPKIQARLEALAPNLDLTVDYGYLTVLAQPLFWLLKAIHGVIGNWGWAIILVTVLIKAAFFKLSETSYKSMANMRRLAPEINRLKERYGDDRQKMNQAMMDLYKKEKLNPLSGCLPILVQIPVFIALYWVLVESVELRQAPFMLWIQDLASKDPYFVLPLVMGATMFIQQQLNPPPPDPVQAKIMMMLPLIFTVFFLWFPAGLVLYWVVNNVLSIAQQYVITKRVEAAGLVAKT